MVIIQLKLVGEKPDYKLLWSTDGRSWGKVSESYPVTSLSSEEEIQWVADPESIEKLNIKFKTKDIFDHIKDNDTRNPNGKSKRVSGPKKDNYIIKVKPVKGGGFKEYDPEINIPPADG